MEVEVFDLLTTPEALKHPDFASRGKIKVVVIDKGDIWPGAY